MLAEERFKSILKLLSQKGSVAVSELTKELNISESTIRRDLNTLDEMGKLHKVHGGATKLSDGYDSYEEDMPTKTHLHIEEKRRIGAYAAGLINENDFVFIDAGTSTEYMIDFIEVKEAVFVTNGISHAVKLTQKGYQAYVIGGQFRSRTEAIVGVEGVNCMQKYNFTKCFLGANGISKDGGFSTPDLNEAYIKMEAVKRSFASFVLADHTKFLKSSPVTFASIGQCVIITDQLVDASYGELTVIKVVE